MAEGLTFGAFISLVWGQWDNVHGIPSRPISPECQVSEPSHHLLWTLAVSRKCQAGSWQKSLPAFSSQGGMYTCGSWDLKVFVLVVQQFTNYFRSLQVHNELIRVSRIWDRHWNLGWKSSGQFIVQFFSSLPSGCVVHALLSHHKSTGSSKREYEAFFRGRQSYSSVHLDIGSCWVVLWGKPRKAKPWYKNTLFNYLQQIMSTRQNVWSYETKGLFLCFISPVRVIWKVQYFHKDVICSTTNWYYTICTLEN